MYTVAEHFNHLINNLVLLLSLSMTVCLGPIHRYFPSLVFYNVTNLWLKQYQSQHFITMYHVSRGCGMDI